MADIDASTIPPEKLNRADFIRLHAELEAAIKNKKWRHAFSIHEAGHWIYYERAGITKFSFIGPKIVYDAAHDRFNGYPAAVKCDESMVPTKGSDLPNWLFTIAKACAAGGTFTRELSGAPDSGDEEDRQNFEQIFDCLPDSDKLDRDELWKAAQESVKKELRSPAFKQFAWSKAADLRVKFFGTDL